VAGALTTLVGFAGLGAPARAATGGARRLRDALAVRVVATEPALGLALTRMPTVYLRPTATGGRLATIRVDAHIRYQRVRSFGAAMTDSSAWLIHDKLPRRLRARVMQDLFSTRHGIGLRFVRVPIGASDFTVTGRPYTYDDQPPGRADPGLADFSISHDLAYIIPTLRQALAIDPRIELLATPWTAPPWMKTNDSFGNPAANGRLLPGDYPVYAEYLVRFLEAYRALGVPVRALTVQNEPDSPTFPGGELTPAAEAQLISADLRPALEQAGLGQTAIYGLDDGNRNLAYARQLLGSPAADLLAGIAWHCYGGLSSLDALHAAAPGLDQIVSECSPGIIPYSPAEAVIDALRHWASTVALWNLALSPGGGPVHHPNWSCRGCSGLIGVSERSRTFSLGPAYYELGQISKYVKPGAVRVWSTRPVHDLPSGGVSPGIDDVALRNPGGSLVVVVHNTGSATRVRLGWARRWLVYPLGGGETATFIWRPPGG
jgi:glucosylceramidase